MIYTYITHLFSPSILHLSILLWGSVKIWFPIFQILVAEMTTCSALNAMNSKSIERMHSPFCAVNFGACLYEDDGKKWVIMHNKSLHGRNRVKTEAQTCPFIAGTWSLSSRRPLIMLYSSWWWENIPTRIVPWLSQVVLMILLPGGFLRGSSKNEYIAWLCHKEKL